MMLGVICMLHHKIHCFLAWYKLLLHTVAFGKLSVALGWTGARP